MVKYFFSSFLNVYICINRIKHNDLDSVDFQIPSKMVVPIYADY